MPDYRLTIPEVLTPLTRIRKRFKIVIGGRGSAKSQTIGDICLADSQTGIKVGCFREFQNSIEDSVHSLLCEEIDRLEMSGFNTGHNAITNDKGGEFKFRGLARNTTSIKSMHGFDRFWVEEAQTISSDSLKLLTPTLRKPGSEIWMSANPMSSADPFSQRFVVPFLSELIKHGYYEDDLHLIIVSNYMDNPWFPDVLEQERQHDEEFLSRAEYEHVWLGKFNDEVEGSIIPVDWFDAAIDAHKKLRFKPLGTRIVSHDPSDTGPDSKGLCLIQGSVLLDVQENEKGDVNEGADWATDYAIENEADEFRWDCDGLGVTLKRQITTSLKDTGIKITMFRGSNTPDMPDAIYQPDEHIERKLVKTNRQTFKNKRAQYYFALRDRFYATFKAVTKGVYSSEEAYISLSSNIKCMAKLRSEICRIPRKENPNGMLQIMTKVEMKTVHQIDSPNLSDSVMQAMNLQQVGVDGSYYGRVIKKLRQLKRIGEVPYDPLLPVNTFWQIGDDDSVSIWFAQVRGNQKRLIDYYHNTGEGLAHYMAVMKDTEYVFGTHYMPHSSRTKDNIQIGKRIIDVAGDIGLKPITRVEIAKSQQEVLAEILNTRNFLIQCWIDEEKCEAGIESLENYRKEYDDKKSVHKKTPLNDWAAKGAQALATGVMGMHNGAVVTGEQLMPEEVPDY